MKSGALALMGVAFLALSACGGEGPSSSTQTPISFTIGGTVVGLSGTGLVLQDNAGNNLPVTVNGSFTFAISVTSGGFYNVTVLDQPSTPTQTCIVTNGSGIASANISSIQVACTTITYTIGGMVSGLSGAGLVLQDDAGDNLPVSTNGPFSFATPIASGGPYNVTVLTQPAGPVQSCTVTSGGGIASSNINSVVVSCITATYTVGGTVEGLSGGGLVLQDNTVDNLSIVMNGGFTFPTPIASGGTYSVTVLTQPSGPVQSCIVNNGGGTISATVTNVQIVCAGLWTWVNGSNITNQAGSYGTQGSTSMSNVPGARSGAVSWTDASGDLWLFGGYGYDSIGSPGLLNDLWKYSAGQWTWMSGSNLLNQPGTYGTLGTAAPSNVPGARQNAVSWSDALGNLWLFGGMNALGGTKTLPSYLNDLWRFSGGDWTWMGGSNIANQVGVYGTQGTADPSNVPGARGFASSWTDSDGNLWLFGGGVTLEYFNDMWKYEAGQWTWMSGSNQTNQAGNYGTQGIAAPGNVPGSRGAATVWTDAAGSVLVFGGDGFDATGASGFLNDLWRYSAGEWTWTGGTDAMGQAGTYGTQGIASPGNAPGGREFALSWSDASGNLWLLGGYGVGTPFDSISERGEMGDLWEYRADQWIWVGGSGMVDGTGTYGTLGVASPSDIPGSRDSAIGWTDASGNLWLFGGSGNDSVGNSGDLNDLWEYQP